MGFAQWANAATSALVVVCTAVFVGVYQRKAPWRSTPVGRHLMGLAGSIGMLGLYTVLITAWPAGWPAEMLRMARTVLLLTIAAVMLRLAALVVRAQRRDDAAAGAAVGRETARVDAQAAEVAELRASLAVVARQVGELHDWHLRGVLPPDTLKP